MQVLRARLYALAATLFQRPGCERTQRLCRLTAELLYQAPADAPWLQPLAGLADALAMARDSECCLEAAYRRLFILGRPAVPAQPFGSRWLEPGHKAPGCSVAELRQLMQRHGVWPALATRRQPDHLVTELEFMAWLVEQGETTRSSQRALLQEHLACWIPAFAAAVRRAGPPLRFGLAAELLEALITWDLGLGAPAEEVHGDAQRGRRA